MKDEPQLQHGNITNATAALAWSNAGVAVRLAA